MSGGLCSRCSASKGCFIATRLRRAESDDGVGVDVTSCRLFKPIGVGVLMWPVSLIRRHPWVFWVLTAAAAWFVGYAL